MPSSVAYALTAVALGVAFFPAEQSRRLYAVAVGGAVLLDVDAIGRPFGLGDVAWLGGHRALTHSLAFAAVAAAGLAALASRGRAVRGQSVRLWACFALALAAHGGLDALTTYGEGVMFLAPFSAALYKAPWKPFEAIIPEVVLVWVPASAVIWARRRGAMLDRRARVP